MQDTLKTLKQSTTIVADSSDFETLAAYTPQDATTNPSLILKALQKEEYQPVLEAAIASAGDSETAGEKKTDKIIDHLLVGFGLKILEIVPGRVSTEVDARLSLTRRQPLKKHDSSSRSTRRQVSPGNAFSLKSPLLGRASERLRSSRKRGSAAT